MRAPTRKPSRLFCGRRTKPTDPQVYSTLATYYNRQTDYDKLFKALEDGAANEPTGNPERFYTLLDLPLGQRSAQFPPKDR